MGWLDDILTNAGNSLVGTQQPFGSLMGQPDPAQRSAMINSALLSLGGTLSQAGRQGVGPMEAIGQGFRNLSAEGQQRGQNQLQSALLMSKIGEQQKRNQTREALKKNLPPGMTAEMIDALPDDQLGKTLVDAYRQQRIAAAYGGDGGGGYTAPMPSGGGGTAPSPTPGGGFNIGNLRAQGGGFQTFGTPEEAVAAAVRNVQRYPAAFNGGQPMTLMQVGARWAPKGDGANDPVQWARNVASIGGLPVDQPLDFQNPDVMQRFARGVHGAEFGQRALFQPDVYQRGVQALSGGSGGPSPVQPAQYTPQGQGAPAAPAANPAANDPELATLRRSRQQALMAGETDKIPQIDAAIARREGALADRGFEMERSQAQGAERARIAQDTERLKIDLKSGGEFSDGIQNNALKARTTFANLQQLDKLLDRVDTGKFTGTAVEIKKIAKGMGINLDALGIADNVGPAEAARALSNQLTLQMRELAGGMPGAMSDPDRRFLQEMIPNLETSKEGRKLMIDYMKRVLDHQIKVAKEVSKYRQSEGWKKNPQGIIDAAASYSDANPIFREEDFATAQRAIAGPQAGAPQPQTGAPPPPKVGDTAGPYTFMGGDPGDENNWKRTKDIKGTTGGRF